MAPALAPGPASRGGGLEAKPESRALSEGTTLKTYKVCERSQLRGAPGGPAPPLPSAVPEAGPPVLAPCLAQPSPAIPVCLSPPAALCPLQRCSYTEPSPWPWGAPCPGCLPSHALLLPAQPSGHLP